MKKAIQYSLTFVSLFILVSVSIGQDAFDQTVVRIKTLEARLEQNQQRVEADRERGERAITQFQKSHKLNAPKDMFESDADYARRKSQLEALVSERRDVLHKQYLESKQSAIGEIQTQITRLYRRVFPTNNITVQLGKYDANNQFFPVIFQSDGQHIHGHLNIKKGDARELYNNWYKVTKTGYLSIDPGYRRALAMVKLSYTPIWRNGVTWRFHGVYHLGDNNITVAFSPNGQYLATGTTGSGVTLWKVIDGEAIRQMTHGARINALSFSPDGKYLATGGTNLRATLWEMVRGTKVRELVHSYRSGLVTVSSSVTSRRETRTPQMAEGDVYAIAFSSDGRYLVTGDDTKNPFRSYVKNDRAGNATIWKVDRGRLVQRMIHEIPTGRVRVTSSVTSRSNSVRYREVKPGGRVNAVAFSPDGKHIATGSNNVSIWKVSSGRRVRQMEEHGKIYAIVFSPDGKYLVTGSSSGKVALWQANGSSLLWQVTHTGRINAVSFSADGEYLAVSGSKDRTITFYRIPANITIETRINKVRTIQTNSGVSNLAWSPYGNLISDGKKVYRTLLQPEIY